MSGPPADRQRSFSSPPPAPAVCAQPTPLWRWGTATAHGSSWRWLVCSAANPRPNLPLWKEWSAGSPSPLALPAGGFRRSTVCPPLAQPPSSTQRGRSSPGWRTQPPKPLQPPWRRPALAAANGGGAAGNSAAGSGCGRLAAKGGRGAWPGRAEGAPWQRPGRRHQAPAQRQPQLGPPAVWRLPSTCSFLARLRSPISAEISGGVYTTEL